MTHQQTNTAIIECVDLPETPDPSAIYRLMPKAPTAEYYAERTDRNIGIITETEQAKLKKSTVGIAGCGGMGGLVAAQLARIGVGHIKIADSEVFDLSNLNRQFAARIDTVGANKAFTTAAAIRSITPDVTVSVFPQGITELSVAEFVKGCDVICDEIEFFAVRPRIQLHQAARKAGISLFCCDVIGFGSRIFRFTPDSMTVEDFLGLSGEEKIEPWVVRRLLSRFAPELPKDIPESLVEAQTVGQKKATIFGGTPPLSAGILLNSVCLHLMGSERRPWVQRVPAMPGYCLFDVGEWKVKIHRGVWWHD